MSKQPNAAVVGKICDELAHEHATIRTIVDKLRQPQEAPKSALPLLDELHGTLASHFAHEEYPGGFYETLGACVPEHGEDLRILLDGHFLILSATQSLKERARGAAGDSFDRDLLSLVDSISRHERR